LGFLLSTTNIVNNIKRKATTKLTQETRYWASRMMASKLKKN